MSQQVVQGSKYAWQVPEKKQEQALSIAASYNLSLPLCHALLSRGFASREQIDAYLFSSKERDISSAVLMKDAQKAVDRINHAIKHKEKILVFGDYDVDGITSSSLMMTCLMPLDAQVNFYLPHRVKEGYGLSTKVVKRAAQNDYKVIITVDNGTTAFEQAQVAKELGVDLIITDHHRPHDELPDAFALVNPHQKDCDYPFKELAGVGVTFKILSLLYEQRGLSLPEKAYELLMLGTIADVVPLTGENRFWVRYGLQHVNKAPSLSLNVLKTNGKVTKSTISSTDIGFRIAPQINALGRLQDPRQGVAFLLGSDKQETERVGTVLFELNQVRKEIERSIFEDVQQLIESGKIDLSKENVILAASKKWPPGVIGLVASRLVGQYARPTLLFHLTDKGKAKGSCRSIEPFNIFNALQDGEHLIDQFGGHAMAAGLSLPVEKLGQLKEVLEERTRALLKPEDFINKLKLDGAITMGDVSKKLMHDMQYFEPFGAQNSEPKFILKGVSLVQKPQLLKEAHIKCMVFADGIIKPIIFFNRPELYQPLLDQQEEQFDIAVQVTENHWQGRTNIEFFGLDVAGMKGTE
jgi:single-stranded-DNA-specific exonuclease